MLKEAIWQIESVAKLISFNDEVNKFFCGKSEQVAFWLRHDFYYKALAAYCKIYEPKNVAEVGTMYGNSAIALGKYAKKVTTYDIALKNVINTDIFNHNIKGVELAHPDDCVKIDFSQYDFLYIDIGDHNGYYEAQIHKKLLATYKGIVFYDDVNWHGLKQLWESIECEKEFTDWHGDGGFGVVNYV